MGPLRLKSAELADVDDDVEALAIRGALDGRLPLFELLACCAVQNVAPQIRLDRSAELVQLFDTMHLEKGVIGVRDRLVRLDDNDPFVDAGNDLLELRAVGIVRHQTLQKLHLESTTIRSPR